MFPVSVIVVILYIMFMVYFILFSGGDINSGLGLDAPIKLFQNVISSYKSVFNNEFEVSKQHKWYVMTTSLIVFLSNAMTIIFLSYFVYRINEIIKSDMTMDTAVDAYNAYVQINYTYLFGYTALRLIHGTITTYAYSISNSDNGVRAIKYTSDLWLGDTNDVLKDIFSKWSVLIATIFAKPIILTILSVFLQFVKNRV